MVSGIITAALFGLFLIGTIWAYSPRRKREFDAAAALPLYDDDAAPLPLQDNDAFANASDDAANDPTKETQR
jgi:cytochrome c oxidase cbb3-type subunit 4